MGSIIPFPDLNLFPHPTTISTPTITAGIRPKLEPVDEPPLLNLLQPPPYIQNPNYLNSTPISPPNTQSNSEPNPNDVPQAMEDENDYQSNVLSEYNRITELFHSAFSQSLQKYDGEEAGGEFLDDFRAIVPVPEQNQLSTETVTSNRRYQQRSSELVRVTNLSIEDERYFRDVVRRTRMVFDSLRVFSAFDDEKRLGLGFKRSRCDLRAAKAMKERGLWLNRDKRIVGAIPGIEIGDVFFFRMELCVVGMHGQAQAGIDYLTASQSANGEPIATSIIVSGGYEDDEDAGDVIFYTGHGGQDKNSSRQCVHQKLEGGNLGLERSMHYGIEVRVIRGFKYDGSASGKVYVYDGLYNVIDTWFDVGKSGFGVYKFKLIRVENQPEMGTAILRFAQNLRTLPLAVRPTGYVSLDISMKKESVPVFLFNDVDDDHEPMYYDYLVTTVFPPYAYQIAGTGCDCVSGCFDGCLCALKNGGEFAYDRNGILVRGKPLIFECGPHCHCPPSCRNRVSQKGVRNRLEVFRSRETGWGVRSLDLIQAGAFICEYTGVVLTREQAQIISMNGDSLVYPNRFAERWAEWGDLSQVFSDYVRPSYPSIPPLDFAMDVSRMRNVACYMSHTSCPNVLVQLVLYDHNNVSFPHLMIFAMENIPPLREISLDYGVADEWEEKLPICN